LDLAKAAVDLHHALGLTFDLLALLERGFVVVGGAEFVHKQTHVQLVWDFAAVQQNLSDLDTANTELFFPLRGTILVHGETFEVGVSFFDDFFNY